MIEAYRPGGRGPRQSRRHSFGGRQRGMVAREAQAETHINDLTPLEREWIGLDVELLALVI